MTNKYYNPDNAPDAKMEKLGKKIPVYKPGSLDKCGHSKAYKSPDGVKNPRSRDDDREDMY